MRACLCLAIAALLGLGPPPIDSAQAIRESTDVPWLERIASSQTIASLLAEPANYSAKSMRTEAYVRLGAIGSPESLAAIRRIENSIARVPMLSREGVVDGRWPHPAPHMGDPLLSRDWVPRLTAPDGTEFAVERSDQLGGAGLYLLQRKKDAKAWSRPFLVAQASDDGTGYYGKMSLEWTGEGVIQVSLTHQPPDGAPDRAAPGPAPKPLTIRLSDALKDSDGDGWTDIEERWLGTDPAKADTDGDGIPDGLDVCPLYAPPATEAADEEAQILKRAAFAIFGIAESRYALLVRPPSRPLQFSSFAGPILYDKAMPADPLHFSGGGVYVKWKISAKSADSATVEIEDWEGPLAASGERVTLKKINGEWFVVAQTMVWIS